MPGLTDHKPDIKPADTNERKSSQRNRTKDAIEEEIDEQLERRLENERDATVERAEASLRLLRKYLNKRRQQQNRAY